MNKKDITNYPFSNINSRQDVIKFLENTNLASNYDWVLPQIQAHFAREIEPVKIDGKYCGLATMRNIKNAFTKGLWFYVNSPRSGLILGSPLYKVPEYNNLVPLLLSAYKTYHNISYSSWSKETLDVIVDAELCESMLFIGPELSAEQWLEVRDYGLRFRTGPKKGQLRNPATSHMLYGLSSYADYPIDGIPKLALVMYTQIWCAHPANRSPKMVLNPSNWDAMPAPLIQTEIFQPAQNLGAEIPPWER